ncbi:MarR family winged helix-turn-helix transcriptional regulator [Actinomadura sediminis]|uniref:MarR family winged helix-turn-helix transcriptional regulator n=1 Tax=Actinomadura sediminis TaxID=1038904 RepID=A0ABW3EQN7_9ACTN
MKRSPGRPPSLLALPSYLASQVSRFGRWHLESALAGGGLALVHHAILAALDDFGPLSQQEVADALALDKSHLVARIDHLEKAGLVRRGPDPADRRRHRLTLTGEGERTVERFRPIAQESQREFLAVLSPEERRTLVSLLEKVLRANDAAGNPSASVEPPQLP